MAALYRLTVSLERSHGLADDDVMTRIAFVACAASAMLFTAPAGAQDDRDLCADRPALSSTPCTVPAGRVVYEASAVAWNRDRSDDGVVDTIVLADSAVRIGLTRSTEIELAWTPIGIQRRRDATTGAVERSVGVGDVGLRLRQNLRNPDGSGVSIAIIPGAILPTGGRELGLGDWAATLQVAASVDLGAGVQLALTPEIDAAVDADGRGRHLAYGSVVGVSLPVGGAVTAIAETQLLRDDDPAGRTTQALGAVALTWQPSRRVQLDIGSTIGLNRAAPDLELYVGIARRF